MDRRLVHPLGFWWLMVSMAVLLVQILLGTQVREAIDQVAEYCRPGSLDCQSGGGICYSPVILLDCPDFDMVD